MPTKVLIKGAGEHASGTAHRLFRCGFRVAMTDIEWPTAVRRTVSFSSAIRQRTITIEGVTGIVHAMEQADALEQFDWSHIPVFVDPCCRLKDSWTPDVIIDGRILKRNLDNTLHDAPLVIGFGPGLAAGQDVHFVVETQRGHDLGRIIADGIATPDTGIPGSIHGHTLDRVLRSPGDGVFQTGLDIGDSVQAGDEIGTVDSGTITAATSGVIRGLLLPGSTVTANQKMGDIDPRGVLSHCHTLSDKTRTLSGAALEIIVSFLKDR